MNGKLPITTEINIIKIWNLNHFNVTQILQILSETVKSYLIAFEKGIDTLSLECAKVCAIILKSDFFKH